MRIALLTPAPPYPARQGAALRNLALLRALARAHEVVLFSLGAEVDPALRALCAEVQLAPRPAPRPVWQRAMGAVVGTVPDLALRCYQPALAARLADALADGRIEAVQIEGLEMAAHWLVARRRVRRVPWAVYDAHNAEHVLQARAAALERAHPTRWPVALYSQLQARKLRRFERVVRLACDLTLAVSDADRAALHALAPQRAVEVLPNGVDVASYPVAPLRPLGAVAAAPRLLFFGTLDYRPNVDAARWLADEIWPLVRRAFPAAHLAIVGARPGRSVRALGGRPGIVVHGDVSDVRPYLVEADVVVVPLRFGAGSRLKVLEALAAGRPVVSTPLGCEGLAVHDGCHVMFASDAPGFAAAVGRLCRETGLRERLARAGRQLVEERYDWSRITPHLLALYERRSRGGCRLLGRRPAVVLALAVGLLVLGVRQPYAEPWVQEVRFGAVAMTSPLVAPHLDLAEDVPVAHTGMNPFGINTFFDQEPDPERLAASMRLISAAGFGWIRQQFPWADIEQPAKGQYWDTRWNKPSWEKYDRIVALAQQHGLQLIARLDYPPAWARSDQRWPYGPPDRYEDFGDFVATFVARYRGQVRYIQIWNEPNLEIEWGMQPPNAADYVRLLRIAATRAREANPEVVILAAALAPTVEEGPRNISDLTFLRQMYEHGARPYFDIASFNPYGLRSGPYDHRAAPEHTNVARVLLARAIMVEHGDAAKPIWAGELGWNALPLDFPDPPTHGRVTREQQARYTVALYARALTEWPWMGVLNLWHFWKPYGDPRRQQEVYFGAVNAALEPYPVFTALSALARGPAWLGRGYHEETHRALRYTGRWETEEMPRASLGRLKRGRSGDRVTFRFAGTDLDLVLRRAPEAGRLAVTIDGTPTRATELRLAGQHAILDARAPREAWQVRVPVARHLPPGQHQATVEVLAGGPVDLDGVVVGGAPYAMAGGRAWLLGVVFVGAATLGTWLGRRARG